MDAKQLMIGDWVQSSDGLDKITALCAAWAQCMKHSYGYSEIQPIPLTAEILEKNGFVYREAEETCATEAFHLWLLKGSIFAIDDDSWWRSVKDGELHVTFGGFPLKYVHELQHALRLCGIDKEIEI